ncbi:MAG: hypothetical protein RLY97_481 [Pseudomonadota bacterium]|jgi:hypothetical protein
MIAILTNALFAIVAILAVGSILLTVVQYGADWQGLSAERDALTATRKLRITVYHPREPICDAVVYQGNFGAKPKDLPLQSGLKPVLEADLRPDLHPELRAAA